jgi:3-isopropylmalate/(R)-2-methylmalate dehydratase small subunit
MTIVTGRPIVLRGDNFDTTHILPARFHDAAEDAELTEHLFEDDRKKATLRGTTHPFDDPARAEARILIVGANFGSGPAAERAAAALHARGIRAIVGESFAETFVTGALHVGMPCVTAVHRDLVRMREVAEASPSRIFDVDIERQMLLAEGEVAVLVQMSRSARDALMSGSWQR